VTSGLPRRRATAQGQPHARASGDSGYGRKSL